ncbi:response regulator transcription factor [Streptomyces sp. NPDC000151]|uniref:response regulator transcription factor n=1 Tax=Streptomyces sp. NPDC000151 TaxID=3154244 RepID=UPI003320F2A5
MPEFRDPGGAPATDPFTFDDMFPFDDEMFALDDEPFPFGDGPSGFGDGPSGFGEAPAVFGDGPLPGRGAPLRVLVADDNPVVRAGLTVLLSGRPDIEVVAEAADGRQAYDEARLHRPDVVLLDVRMPGVDGISALPHLARLAPVMMLTYSRESALVRESLRLGAGGYLVHGEFTADELADAVRDITAGRARFTTTACNALLAHVRSGGAPYGTGQGAGASPSGHRVGAPDERAAPANGNSGQNGPAGDASSQYCGAHSVSNSSRPLQTTSQPQVDMAQSATGPHRAAAAVPAQRDGARWAQQGNGTDRFGLSHREAEVMGLIAAGMTNAQIAATCFISEKTVKNHINRIFTKLHATSRSQAIAVWLGTARRGTQSHG